MTKDEAILNLTEEQLNIFADRERAVGYRQGHMAALAQRTWVGLTDEEYAKLAEEFGPFPINQIEAKLKEKNNG